LHLLQHHLDLARLFAEQLLYEATVDLAGERYSRDKPLDGRYSRWGHNPGSVRIGTDRSRCCGSRITRRGRPEPVTAPSPSRSSTSRPTTAGDGGVLALKENQPHLKVEVEALFQRLAAQDYAGCSQHQTTDGGQAASALVTALMYGAGMRSTPPFPAVLRAGA
jgi:hypothetical protein